MKNGVKRSRSTPVQDNPGKPSRPGEAELGADIKARVAWLYYMEGMTQDQIAQEVGLHRTRVLRMLSASRQDGTVQIRVTANLSRCVELERCLEATYGIERAIVIPEPREAAQVSQTIGAVLGAYIADNLTDRMTIGLGWGRTLSCALPAIVNNGHSDMTVVSLLGGLTKVSTVNPSEFAWRMADRLSASCYMLAAPVFAPDARTREALMTHPGIREIFHRATQLDMAILSVGDLSPQSTFAEYGLLERDELASLHRAGAVGDILCRFINAEGEVIDHPVNERVVAVDPRNLTGARKLVLASGGWHKYQVILASIRLLRPHVLVTDEVVAERLVETTG
ncbi:DeoR family transcriptional regulator [Mesorhizobium ephedrae]|jgi:DNA-binding transcriptional regulator LsrR (DeoR family)|uniref:DeoR family transcriptional regulator n=1 Tax=Kumtagia ephedrae TaxID=2116701 RepID=A0A2P7SAU1_9HYPH|nr:DeoR family transcriptional regulator [Mesorhizobium ephedrae]